MASMAEATDRPSARAGPIDPIETATTAPMMLTSFGSMRPPSGVPGAADGGADEDGCQYREDVGLDETDQDLQHHQRHRDEEPGKGNDEGDDELAAHDVPEQADHQREGPGDLGQDVERQHDE